MGHLRQRHSPKGIPARTHLCWLGLLFLLLAGCADASRSSHANLLSLDDPLTERARKILADGLSAQDPRVRIAAIESIAATDQVHMMPRIRPLLRDRSMPVRFAALLAVGDTRYSLARDDALQIYGEGREDLNIRVAAAYALGCLGHRECTTFYFSAISDKNPTVRANAALLIGKNGDRSGLKLLHWALQDRDSDGLVRTQVVESLARLGDPEIYARIWRGLISAFADDRIQAVSAMGALGTERSQETLVTMLDDSVLEVRLCAAQHLGKLGDSTGQPQVIEALNGRIEGQAPSQVQTRVLTATAIGEIGTDVLVKHLAKFLTDPSPFVQLAGARAVLTQNRG